MNSLNWKRVDNTKDLPKTGTYVYACVNDEGVITYIGQTTQLYTRAYGHKSEGLQEPHYLIAACPKSELDQTEMGLIEKHTPKNNVKGLKQYWEFRPSNFTPDDIRSIRQDPRDKYELSEVYGVTPANIYQIKTHKSWKHIK